MFKDIVRVADQGIARLLKRGKALTHRSWFQPQDEKSVVEVKGWVRALCNEQGKREAAVEEWIKYARHYEGQL